MAEHGIVQWQVGSLGAEQIADEVARGDWHALDEAGQDPAAPTASPFTAAVRLLEADPCFWGEHERRDEPAVYAHGLMTDPAASGRGLGATVLDLALAEARHRGARWLRLDCAPHLLDYYLSLGFSPVGRRETEAFVTLLLEKTARGGAPVQHVGDSSPATGLPVVSVGRTVTSEEVADALDDDPLVGPATLSP